MKPHSFLLDLPITRKLGTAFLILALISLLTGWIAIERLAAINATTVEMRSNWLIGIQTLGEAKNFITDERRLVNEHILAEEPRDKARMDALISSARLQFETVWGSYATTVTQNDEKQLVADFRQKYETYLREISGVLEHSRSNRAIEARGWLNTKAGPAHDATRTAMQELMRYNQNGANATVVSAAELFDSSWKWMVSLMLAFILVSAGLVWLMQQLLLSPILNLTHTLEALAAGRSDFAVTELERADEIGRMAQGLLAFQASVVMQENTTWIKSHSSQIMTALQGMDNLTNFARQFMLELTPLAGAQVGVFYAWDEQAENFTHLGSYGYKYRKGLVQNFALGEGIVGQCALERTPITLSEVPPDYIHISSGLGNTTARYVQAIPVISSDGRILAVVELASLTRLSVRQQGLIEEILPLVSLNIDILNRNQRSCALPAQSQPDPAALVPTPR